MELVIRVRFSDESDFDYMRTKLEGPAIDVMEEIKEREENHLDGEITFSSETEE